MSYQVLARKWRPKNFQELMGQEHVVNVLVNALSQKRLHHAYLFTGTRGVGKTTIARIFAKSLNCEIGITDKPCGLCDACVDIDQGRFVDLLEIDAASKTKVDDTREILDNVQYAPSRGRFKVYLIDEVHMLSRHSFNALLKTLEEPPEHVKFILATTDPQKLPITVLSRCLQFHLKALTVKQIEDKLTEILSKEQVTHEKSCLTLLAKAARGSMRDSLSLTDQAIAQGQGNISLKNIQQMLGGIDQNWVYQLVIALLKQDSQALMALSQDIASYAPSYSQLFAELIQLFHQIALMQIVEQHFDLPADLLTLLKKFSQTLSAEDVQLYYQISLNGRKDLPYASDEQAAFDMTLLRLFAFKPMQKSQLSSIDTKACDAVNFDNVTLTKPIEGAEVPANNLNNKQAEQVTPIEHNLTSSIASDEAKQDVISDVHSVIEATNPSEFYDESQYELNTQMLEIEQQASELVEHIEPVYQEKIPPVTPQDMIPPQARTLPENNQSSASAAAENISNFDMQHDIQPVKQPVIPSGQENKISIDSPVSSVLATRNMLRSRKKELDKETKKPNDVAMRQSSKVPNSENSSVINEQISAKIEKKLIVPEPEVPFHQDSIDPTKVTKANQVDKWAHMIDSMELTARIRQLAIHATISENSTDDNLILQLNQSTRHLKTEVAHQQLQNTISEFLSRRVIVTLEIVEETVADPYQIQVQINDKRLEYAKKLVKEDANVIALQDAFQATLNEESIAPR